MSSLDHLLILRGLLITKLLLTGQPDQIGITMKQAFISNPNTVVSQDHRQILLEHHEQKLQKTLNTLDVKGDFIHKRIAYDKISHLPPIQSPFLKKTITNLFAYNSHQPKSKAGFQKYSEPIFDQELRREERAQRIFNSAQFVEEDLRKEKKQTRIGKSWSEVKPISRIHADQSSPFNAPGSSHDRAPTEQSIGSKSSRQAIDKLLQAKIIPHISQSKRLQMALAQKTRAKDPKVSHFITKQKVAQSLFKRERQELKFVLNILASRCHQQIDKTLKVKNYAGLGPNVIHIEP